MIYDKFCIDCGYSYWHGPCNSQYLACRLHYEEKRGISVIPSACPNEEALKAFFVKSKMSKAKTELPLIRVRWKPRGQKE